MSRYLVRHFDPRRGPIYTGHRFRIFAQIRFWYLRAAGYTVTMTDQRNGWRLIR